MKYLKLFENFTSQINEEVEILKSIRKLFGKKPEADLAQLPWSELGYDRWKKERGITPSWKTKYTDWAKNKSGNPELAMKLMSRYWDLKNHPEMPVKYKDFNNLKNAEELQDLIKKMEEIVRINKLMKPGDSSDYYKKNIGSIRLN